MSGTLNHRHPPVKELLQIATPSIVSRLSAIFVAVAATVIVGHLGITVLSAYGLATPLILTVFLFTASFLMVFTVRACHVANEPQRLGEYLISALFLAMVFAALGMLVVVLLPIVLPRLGQNRQIVDLTGGYFAVMIWSLPAKLANVVFGQLFIVLKRGRRVMLNATIYVFVTLTLICVLTLGPLHWGLKGVAVGLTVGDWTALAIYLIYFCRDAGRHVQFVWPGYRACRDHILFLLRLGWPLSLQFSSEILSGTAATLMIGHLNTHVLAVQQATMQARVFLLMIPNGICQGCTVLIARYAGNKELHGSGDVYALVRCALWLGLAMMSPFLLWLAVWPHSFITLFFHGQTLSPGLRHIAYGFLYIVLLSLAVDLVRFTISGVLRGIGDTRLAMWSSVFGFWAVSIPLAAILGYLVHMPFIGGVLGVRIGLFVGLLAGMLLLWRRFVRKIDGERWRGAAMSEQ